MLNLEDKWVWDFWFAQQGQEHHMFYLQAPKALGDERLRHFNASIGHACSLDLIHWTILPDAIGPGEAGAWDDQATWTGCTFRHRDSWFLFYTGISSRENGKVQRIGLAVSDDLIHWEKHAANPIIEADSRWYQLKDDVEWHDQAWRDPWIFLYAKQFHAFITARSNQGIRDGRGVIAHAVSNDLLNWEVHPPVTKPGNYGQLEVPQLIEVKAKPYLIFSTDKFSHSRRLLDKTQSPPITGTACYAGETFLGPFREVNDPWLFGDEAGTLYSGKFIGAEERGWTLMAFKNYGEDGEFMGHIPDPFVVTPPE
ncbi:MAG: glycosyl hydrolase family 32 [Candidatus Marinimicrobia bacterium]|nr:glycosyl hydrolase family 32 [Candidatus Neomarinimicrobiota bacterium]